VQKDGFPEPEKTLKLFGGQESGENSDDCASWPVW